MAARGNVLADISLARGKGKSYSTNHVTKAINPNAGRLRQSLTWINRKELFVAENIASSDDSLELCRCR